MGGSEAEPDRRKNAMSFFSEVGRVTRRGFNQMIEARQRQAERYVNNALLSLDDETLRKAGYNRKNIQKRGGHGLYF